MGILIAFAVRLAVPVTRRSTPDYPRLPTCPATTRPPRKFPPRLRSPTEAKETRHRRNEETQREDIFAHPGFMHRSTRPGETGLSPGPHHLQPELFRRARALAPRPEV